MNCIHCKGKVPKVADPTRIIICNTCTQNLVLTYGRSIGDLSPSELSQAASKRSLERIERLTMRELKPLEGRYA